MCFFCEKVKNMVFKEEKEMKGTSDMDEYNPLRCQNVPVKVLIDCFPKSTCISIIVLCFCDN